MNEYEQGKEVYLELLSKAIKLKRDELRANVGAAHQRVDAQLGECKAFKDAVDMTVSGLLASSGYEELLHTPIETDHPFVIELATVLCHTAMVLDFGIGIGLAIGYQIYMQKLSDLLEKRKRQANA